MEKIITFEEGIPGFETYKEYVILEESTRNFFYLESVQNRSLFFVIIDPFKYMPSYSPDISEKYFEFLGGGETSDFALYAMVNLGKSLHTATANLKAPILINTKNFKGVQTIIENTNYDIKTSLVQIMKGCDSNASLD
ncbi:hypothetical protein AN640_06145 [Candidatus Epulonipiscium fishelsonii]|uniref:Uncharacterized protein n=1 Tax=Candidatus Epulonipiscium fishelsonii TaxID=77094 RepID=A0ACC8XHZ5_9FIRM|nr:hypothetical protein AN640_06145 [Epulopiscium sp. SCG-D08WGA-EpuloA1]OON94993.1 MAG: hypothetical protein ATN32_01340 [Epulopiscium sp. AS2M-Bin002]